MADTKIKIVFQYKVAIHTEKIKFNYHSCKILHKLLYRIHLIIFMINLGSLSLSLWEKNLERRKNRMWMRNVPIIFGLYRPRSHTRSWVEANITPRMLVKCRALASVTAAVGNKITVLHGLGHCAILRQAFLCVFISNSWSWSMYVYSRIDRKIKLWSQIWPRLQFCRKIKTNFPFISSC